MAAVSNKRKRTSVDQGGPDPPQVPGAGFAHMSPPNTDQAFEAHYLHNPHDGDLNLAEALAQHNAGTDAAAHDADANGQTVTDTASAALQHFSMTVPQSTETTFLAQTTNDSGERQSEPNFDIDSPSTNAQQSTGNFSEYINTDDPPPQTTSPPPQQQQQPQSEQTSSVPPPAFEESPTSGKPNVGSDEWHKVRRDNHKEVERRRRETINEGINELAKIVPGCEKNKGSILARAVQFIQQLKDNENQNIEKWTLEKLLTEQAIAELSGSCDKLKAENKALYAELEELRSGGGNNGTKRKAEGGGGAAARREEGD